MSRSKISSLLVIFTLATGALSDLPEKQNIRKLGLDPPAPSTGDGGTTGASGTKSSPTTVVSGNPSKPSAATGSSSTSGSEPSKVVPATTPLGVGVTPTGSSGSVPSKNPPSTALPPASTVSSGSSSSETSSNTDYDDSTEFTDDVDSAEATDDGTEPETVIYSTKPNILLILVDDQGHGDIDMGNDKDEFHTPTLATLAKEGVKLSNFYSASTCTPARAMLLTGRYTMRYGFQDSVLHATEPRGVPLTETFLGQKLQSVGYTTVMIGKW
jgi:hypothetical protein